MQPECKNYLYMARHGFSAQISEALLINWQCLSASSSVMSLMLGLLGPSTETFVKTSTWAGVSRDLSELRRDQAGLKASPLHCDFPDIPQLFHSTSLVIRAFLKQFEITSALVSRQEASSISTARKMSTFVSRWKRRSRKSLWISLRPVGALDAVNESSVEGLYQWCAVCRQILQFNLSQVEAFDMVHSTVVYKEANSASFLFYVLIKLLQPVAGYVPRHPCLSVC